MDINDIQIDLKTKYFCSKVNKECIFQARLKINEKFVLVASATKADDVWLTEDFYVSEIKKEIHHPDMVQALCKSGETIANEMNGDKAHLLHMAVGISGESGELLDQIKKHVIYNKPLDRENVIEELGDLEFYIEGLRQGLGVERDTILKANIEKLSKRYEGLNYSDSAANERADKK